MTPRARPSGPKPSFNALASRLFDESSHAILVIDGEFDRIVDANPAARRLFGYEHDELVSLTPSDICPHDVERFLGLVEQAKRHGRGFRDDFSCRTRNGVLVPVEVSLSTVALEGMDLLLAIVRDLSGRRPTEDALRRSKDRYRDLFESAYDIVILADGDGVIIDINRRGAEVSGWSRQDLLMSNLLDLVVPEDQPMFRSVLEEVVEGQEKLYDVRWMTADGRVVRLEGATSALRNSAGRPRWIRCTLRDITRRWELEQRLTERMFYDSLTGLPNRTLLLDRLGELLKRRDPEAEAEADPEAGDVAVLYIGLDQFGLVNDSLGHTTGDEILRLAGERLSTVLSGSDQIGRVVGDEFVIVREVDDVDGAIKLAQTVLIELQLPFYIGTDEVAVGASVGIALFSDGSAQTSDSMLRSSHAALCHAKELGRRRWALFSAEHKDRADRLVKVRSELHRALEQSELVLHYQPLVDADTGLSVGVEALVRWQHPSRGLLGPDQFIPMAEETGLIIELGDWVLREAVTTVMGWRHTKGEGAAFFVSVNVAAGQLIDPGFLASVERVLASVGADPASLVLEITETQLLADPVAAEHTLVALRDFGVGIAMDDFGVGYSSLGFLRRFPIDKLKIDRSFIRDLPDDRTSLAILNAITQLAHTLDMDVVAEGVETEEQLEAVVAAGCDLVQGYLFARPASESDTRIGLARAVERHRRSGT